MINTELYTLNHGSIKRKQQAYIDTLEAYFKPRRENVVGVTILPNFCIDKDMTNYIHHLYSINNSVNVFLNIDNLKLNKTYITYDSSNNKVINNIPQIQ